MDRLQQRVFESSSSSLSSVVPEKLKADLECVTEMLAYRSGTAPNHRGFHISSWNEQELRPSDFEQVEFLGCVLQKIGTYWASRN